MKETTMQKKRGFLAMPVIMTVFCVALMLALASCGGTGSPAGDTAAGDTAAGDTAVGDTAVFQGTWLHDDGGEKMVFSGNNWRNYFDMGYGWETEFRGTFTTTASRIYFTITERFGGYYQVWEVIPPQDREQYGAYYLFHSGNAQLELSGLPMDLAFFTGVWNRQ